jgi:hypothetical protein
MTSEHSDSQYGIAKRGFELGIFRLHFTKKADDWQEGEIFSIAKLFSLTVSGQPFSVSQSTRATFHFPKCLLMLSSPYVKMENIGEIYFNKSEY